MKDYIKALIKRDGEQASGKIAEVMKQFIEWIDDNYYIFPPLDQLDSYFEEFQDEVLNK